MEVGRLTCCTRQMKGVVCQRAPAFNDSLVSFYLLIFYLKYIFLILCRFPHINFHALNSLYFIPLFNDNNNISHTYILYSKHKSSIFIIYILNIYCKIKMSGLLVINNLVTNILVTNNLVTNNLVTNNLVTWQFGNWTMNKWQWTIEMILMNL